MSPHDLAAALRALDHAALDVVLTDAAICAGWTFDDGCGENVDYDEDEAAERTERGYLGTLARYTHTAALIDLRDEAARVYSPDGTATKRALVLPNGTPEARLEAAMDQTEALAVAAGWRLPWRVAP